MSHKVHPKSFRIRNIEDWSSRGYYQKNLPQYLEEDFEIRKFLTEKLKKMGIEKIEIERFPKKTNILIYSARPGLIIGRGGEGIEKVKKELIKMISKKSFITEGVGIEIKEVKNPWVSAALSVDWATQQLERRVRHKRVIKQGIEKITSNKEVLGARIELSGRLNGVEIARREWSQKGRLPRQTIRADIDYHRGFARCSYGAIGVKVWIYKGDKFN
ncbi:MAG: 30S ribosomal protein S3 [Candidatus Pacebacteria bacterium]|nr:30S ribosomal protein S3 [Candidatus Paceibacterota bacterium]